MIPSVVTSIFTSLGVSALTTLVLQTYLTKQIQHHFDIQMARYKADLEVQVHIRQELLERRIDAYPKLVELCYRTRNMARNLVKRTTSGESLQEFVARVREMEELLYRFREDLEAHQLFVPVHLYKNLLLEFYRTAAEPLSTSANFTGAQTTNERLTGTYLAIDESYPDIVERLTRNTEGLA